MLSNNDTSRSSAKSVSSSVEADSVSSAASAFCADPTICISYLRSKFID